MLSGVHYQLHARLVNGKHHGIPHNRERLWIIGVKRDNVVSPFSWPAMIGAVSLTEFLDDGDPAPSLADRPAGRTAQENWVQAFKQIVAAKKVNLLSKEFVIDVDGSVKFGPHRVVGCCPCITRSRAHGHWLSKRSRRLRLAEMARFACLLWKRSYVVLSFRVPAGRGRARGQGLGGSTI